MTVSCTASLYYLTYLQPDDMETHDQTSTMRSGVETSTVNEGTEPVN